MIGEDFISRPVDTALVRVLIILLRVDPVYDMKEWKIKCSRVDQTNPHG